MTPARYPPYSSRYFSFTSFKAFSASSNVLYGSDIISIESSSVLRVIVGSANTILEIPIVEAARTAVAKSLIVDFVFIKRDLLFL